MRMVANGLAGLVALAHLGFFVLETFLWTTETGRGVFGTTEAFAAESAVLAANQGVYNLVLALGLLWGLITGKRDVVTYVLAAVVGVGAYGAWSLESPVVLAVQMAPALAALILMLITGRSRAA